MLFRVTVTGSYCSGEAGPSALAAAPVVAELLLGRGPGGFGLSCASA